MLVPLLDDEVDFIPPAFIALVERYGGHQVFSMKQGEDGYCLAFDKQRSVCTIYDIRPTACREFPFNEDDVCTACNKRDESR